MQSKKILLSLLCMMTTLSACNNNLVNNKEKDNETNQNSIVDGLINENLIPNNALSGMKQINDYLYVSHLPGHYNGTIKLDIKSSDPNHEIYYSIDGSKPEITEYCLFDRELELEQIITDDLDDYPLTTSVDGILANDHEGKCVSDIYNNNIQRTGNYPMFQKQNTVSITVVNKETKEEVMSRTLTYIIDDQDYTIPVVSVTMPYDDWFGEENGMYNKIREEIEKRAYLEYFDFENDEYFSLNTRIKLGGNWTLGYPMRTLNLNFNKDEYGNKNDPVKVPVFGDRVTRGDRSKRLTKLRRFRLHSGGNSFESSTGFNDAVIQAMMEDSNAATAGYRPCITYLNGEYWGLYYIREHYKDIYFENNYDVEKDDVNFYELKGGFLLDDGDEETGEAALNSLLDYINNKDFSDYNVYKTFIDEYIDEASFIDLFLAEAYASNWDFVGNNNNLKMWRVSKVDPDNPYTDGKWRFVLHDIDFAFTEYTNFLNVNSANPYSSFLMFRQMLKQEEFRTKFYNRAEELIETNLSASNASRVLSQMVEEIMPYKKDAMMRWGKNESGYEDWLNQVDNTYKYFENKERTFLATVKDSLNQFR